MDYERDFEDGFENTSLGDIHYKYHTRSGKKLIFLHGLGGTTKVWTRLMEYMPDNLDITLLDLLGYGMSDKPQIEYKISIEFQALREFIALRNCGDSYICGQSSGGWLAAYYATQPCSSNGIILIDAAGLKEFFDEITMLKGAKGYIEDLTQRAMHHDVNNKEYVVRSTIEASLDIEDQLVAENLAMIKVSTLIIWGSEDDNIGVKFAKMFVQRIKNSRLEIIQGAGHNPHYTHPKEVSKLILEFVQQHG